MCVRLFTVWSEITTRTSRLKHQHKMCVRLLSGQKKTRTSRLKRQHNRCMRLFTVWSVKDEDTAWSDNHLDLTAETSIHFATLGEKSLSFNLKKYFHSLNFFYGVSSSTPPPPPPPNDILEAGVSWPLFFV